MVPERVRARQRHRARYNRIASQRCVHSSAAQPHAPQQRCCAAAPPAALSPPPQRPAPQQPRAEARRAARAAPSCLRSGRSNDAEALAARRPPQPHFAQASHDLLGTKHQPHRPRHHSPPRHHRPIHSFTSSAAAWTCVRTVHAQRAHATTPPAASISSCCVSALESPMMESIPPSMRSTWGATSGCSTIRPPAQ